MDSLGNLVTRMETPGTPLHPFLIPGAKYKVARHPGKSFTFAGYTNPSKMAGWFIGPDGAQHMFSTISTGSRFDPVFNVGTMRKTAFNRRKHAVAAWNRGGVTGGGSAAAGTRRGRRNRRSRTRRN